MTDKTLYLLDSDLSADKVMQTRCIDGYGTGHILWGKWGGGEGVGGDSNPPMDQYPIHGGVAVLIVNDTSWCSSSLISYLG